MNLLSGFLFPVAIILYLYSFRQAGCCRWVMIVLLIKSFEDMKTKKIEIPSSSLVRRFLPADYNDAFQIIADQDIEASPDDMLIRCWLDMPGWVNGLFRLRNFLVKFAGLQGSNKNNAEELERCIREGSSYRFMEVVMKDDRETVLVMKDTHLDAWLSLRKDDPRTISLSTLVHYNNGLGRFYFFMIRYFHGKVVRAMLRRVVKREMAINR